MGAQKTGPDFTEKANSLREGKKKGKKQKKKKAGNCSETNRGEQRFSQLVTVKNTPLTSPLPYTAHRQWERK